MEVWPACLRDRIGRSGVFVDDASECLAAADLGSTATLSACRVSAAGCPAPLDAAAPLKPLTEPVDLAQYRVRRQARVGGLIKEYRLVA